MQTIWKYELEVVDSQLLWLPKGSQVLSVQAQDGVPRLWALVDTDAAAAPVQRIFYTFGTGHEVKSLGGWLKFIATYQTAEGQLVFHVFEGMDGH